MKGINTFIPEILHNGPRWRNNSVNISDVFNTVTSIRSGRFHLDITRSLIEQILKEL